MAALYSCHSRNKVTPLCLSSRWTADQSGTSGAPARWAGAAGNKQLKQAIELAVSGKKGPEILAANVRKRLASFAKSRSIPSYERGREIIAELDGLRTIIVETIGAENSRPAVNW